MKCGVSLPHHSSGEMAEWPKATVSKIVNGFSRSRVRIPLSPPFFLLFSKRWTKITVKIIKLKIASKLAIEFFIFTLRLSAWRRKRDFFMGCPALLDQRSAMLTLVVALLRRRIPLSLSRRSPNGRRRIRHFYAQILTKYPHFSPLGVAKCPLLCYNQP